MKGCIGIKWLLLLLTLSACSGGTSTVSSVSAPILSPSTPPEISSPFPEFPQDGRVSLGITPINTGFDQPLHITHAGDTSNRVFVVERPGVVRVLNQAGERVEGVFLDIRDRVQCCEGERGIHSIAFPPDYDQKGYFYAVYINVEGAAVLSRFSVTANPDRADASSEAVIYTVPSLENNPDYQGQNAQSLHYGGQIAFSPYDGYLYYATGDGFSFTTSQTLSQPQGKLLRLDVEGGIFPYQVPSDNPFLDSEHPEIWALGLRNPWRFSFDRETGDLYIADVGQNEAEELNVQSVFSPGGENYGWPIMEGKSCYNRPTCNQQGLTLPVFEYGREFGTSLTGGFVYRGNAYPDLDGLYIAGDFGSGKIFALRQTGPRSWDMVAELSTDLNISSFGEDEAGEIYVADFSGGVYGITDLP